MLTLPLNTRLLSSQNYSPFLSWVTKGKSPRGRHLIITWRASILILLVITIIAILICWGLWRRRWRSSETTKVSLLSCNTIDIGVHLTQLIRESVKVSIHTLKLRHDNLGGHITNRGRKSKGGRNNWSCRTSRLHMWLFWLKLGLASLNKSYADGTYNGEVRRIRNRDGKMVKDPRDSWRKDELIMGCRILIDINDGSDEVRGELNRKILKERQQKSSMRLYDRVIVRQWGKNKCHYHWCCTESVGWMLQLRWTTSGCGRPTTWIHNQKGGQSGPTKHPLMAKLVLQGWNYNFFWESSVWEM